MHRKAGTEPIIINGMALHPQSPVHRRKLLALQRFIRGLLQRPVRDRVGKIILFGSVAEGQLHPESDIDILIFGRRPLGELEETCDEVAFETMLQTREDIQPLVHTLADFSHPDSSFVRSVLRKGKELYSMPAEKLKRAEIEGYYELATIYFDAAKRAFDPENEGSLRLAIDGAYNAIELCAKGFLRHEVEALPKPHSGVVTLFRDRWVKRGCLPREFGRRLSRSLKLRNDSR